MAIPASFLDSPVSDLFPDSDLWKPLDYHGESAPVARPGEDSRQSRREVDVECDLSPGGYRLRKGNAYDGLVVLVVVVRMNELNLLCRVFAIFDLHRVDVDPAPFTRFEQILAGLAAGFDEERTLLILKGIEVQMQLQVADRVGRVVDPGE